MPHVQKIGKVNLMCWTPKEADRLPNISLGRHCRVNTNNILMKDNRLNKYVNDSTMGALDNYANHEGMNIYITPLENDLFHDVAVSVYKDHDTIAKFPLKINDGREGYRDFFKELYSKIAPKKVAENIDKSAKLTEKKDIKIFLEDKIDNIKNFRINLIRKFVESHKNDKGIGRTIADVFEEVHYNELYK